jgi:uncharacterized protein (TIGR02246 family)
VRRTGQRAIAVAVVAAALATVGPAWAGAPSNEGGLAGDVANERLVRELYDDFVAAWNRHDVDALANMWAIDGDHLEPDGTVAKGRDAVRALFAREHATVFGKSRLNLSVADVWFVSGDVALVDGGYEIYGIQTADGTELPARRGHLTSVLINEQGKWWIAASRLMIPTELPYKKK